MKGLKGGAKGLLRVPNHNMIVYDSDFRQSNLNFGYVFPLMMDTQQKKHRKHLWDPMFTWRHDEASASHPKFIIEPIDSFQRFDEVWRYFPDFGVLKFKHHLVEVQC